MRESPVYFKGNAALLKKRLLRFRLGVHFLLFVKCIGNGSARQEKKLSYGFSSRLKKAAGIDFVAT